ncbi:hypothetical protein QBC34DRAFT_162945 [Podospora aff. communis PSN243]|uniref:Uncharacterized protein n=1 Tax=Podospora aff. communis PSN243 TaxID=3040156 RepID=A0AAV9GAN4_9PEZI|nr:hypothetical protein QBC34DRAFT_162945 [Podospora aff. communis PSN243]
MYHSTNRMLRKPRLSKSQLEQQDSANPVSPRASSKIGKLPRISAPKLSLDLGPRSPCTPLTDIVPSPFDRTDIPLIQTPTVSTPSGSSQQSSARIDPEERPPWDRSVDVVWRRRLSTPDSIEWDDELAFQENSVRLASQSSSTPTGSPLFGSNPPSWYQQQELSRKGNARYFALPDRVRFKITKYVLASHDTGKSIRLNSPSFLDPIWPVNPVPGPDGAPNNRIWSTEYFDSLKKVLVLLRSYTSVCFAMRVDFMTTLFLTRRFHVVYSPFVSDAIQPAATRFMDEFGSLMKSITLEVDLSRLGGSWEPAAEKMDMEKSVERVRALVKRFANTQLERHGITTIQSLVILVRRYYGYRQSADKTEEQQPRVSIESERSDEHAVEFEDDDGETVMNHEDKGLAPYCPDEYLSVLDPLMLLEGVVDSFCMVGASSAYAKSLMIALWGKDRPPSVRDYCQYRTPSLAYPFTPGQRSAVVRGPGQGVTIVEHVRDPRKWRGLYGCALSQSTVVKEIRRDGCPPSYRVITKAGDEAGPWTTPRTSVTTLATPSVGETKSKKGSLSSLLGKREKGRGKGKENKWSKEAISRGNSPTSPIKSSPSRIPVISRGSGKITFAPSSGSSDAEQERSASSGSSGSIGIPHSLNKKPSQRWLVISKGLGFRKRSSSKC